jgi:cell wall-associated NlpC family hydrolase
MKINQTTLLSSISFLTLTLLNTGCAPKNADGSYSSKYSYHPYTQHQAKKKTIRIVTPRRNIVRSRIQRVKNIPQQYKTKALKKYNKVLSSVQKNKAMKYPSSNHFRSNEVRTNIENIAKLQLGKKYQYGATGPYQYDCSGFTKFVFSKQGIKLPRVSREQARVGQFVSMKNLQKGDLIFFNSKKSLAVSHVGIYLERGNFIHASSSKERVIISNLKTNYYSSHFTWGRRVTNPSYASR